ncbi:MAG: hypothetical protein HZC41_01800 [Chloroflexi bacterium]|nr:hypothetical protein [Chloroflexota bacterium]
MTAVIYVEDDETEALLFQIGLNARGIHVYPIPEISLHSVHSLLSAPYDQAQVVFFDLWIRTTSGIDVGRALRDAGDTRPFVLVTAANNPNPALLKQLGIQFLQKPLDFDAVAAFVRSAT